MSFYKGNNMVAGIPSISQSVTDGDVNAVSADAVYTALGDRASAGSLLDMVAAANSVASAGLAPGGFGLGVANGKTINYTYDLDNLTTGFYSWTTSIPTHAPTADNQYCALTVLPRGAQICTSYSSGITQIRYKASDTWSAWEYVNPPMSLGTEYRTTERHMGLPVYIKRLSFKTLEITGTTTIAHGITNLGSVLFLDGLMGGWTGIQYPVGAYEHVTGYAIDDTNITVTTQNATNPRAAISFLLKYTKTA